MKNIMSLVGSADFAVNRRLAALALALTADQTEKEHRDGAILLGSSRAVAP
jgi:hypothetical protein